MLSEVIRRMRRELQATEEKFAVSELERDYCSRSDIPLPHSSSAERLRNMLVFRNRTHLYNGQCALSGKKMLTCFPPGSAYRACHPEVWSSDQIDNRRYGRPYDFQRGFFAQFRALYQTAYLPGLTVNLATMENCEYGDGITFAKNCYLVFGSSHLEDCMFCYLVRRCRSVLDCVCCYDCELCYECINVRNCYNLKWSEHCEHCRDSSFLFNCTGCSDCYGCTNLVQKQHCFYNQPLGQEAYAARLAAVDLTHGEVIEREKQRFAEFSAGAAVQYFRGTSIETCSGNFLYHSKNCGDCYFVAECEDCSACLDLTRAKNCIVQAYFGLNCELVYHSVVAGENAFNLRFCVECWTNVRDLEYCIQCSQGVAQCFGCVGLRRASCCILNQQYSRAEYEDLTRRIRQQMRERGEYGRFFPATMAPFYYNESTAQLFYPLERAAALKRGYAWHDEAPETPGNLPLPPASLPDNDEQLLGAAYACSETGKAFRYVRPELQFYRAQRIAPPTRAPLERMRRRLGFYNLTALGERACDNCGTVLRTCYALSLRPVLCEDCYQAATYK